MPPHTRPAHRSSAHAPSAREALAGRKRAHGRLHGLGTRDVVILNHAPPALAFQVLKYGREVFARDRTELVAFRVRSYCAHADYAHVERFFREATKRRLLGTGGSHG